MYLNKKLSVYTDYYALTRPNWDMRHHQTSIISRGQKTKRVFWCWSLLLTINGIPSSLLSVSQWLTPRARPLLSGARLYNPSLEGRGDWEAWIKWIFDLSRYWKIRDERKEDDLNGICVCDIVTDSWWIPAKLLPYLVTHPRYCQSHLRKMKTGWSVAIDGKRKQQISFYFILKRSG